MQYTIVAFFNTLIQKFKIDFCIFCIQTIIVRSNCLKQREEEKKKSFKKTSVDHDTVFYFSCCLFQGSNYKYFLDMVKFRNWPESSEEGKFSCSYQKVPTFLENATIEPLEKTQFIFTFAL